MNGNEMMRNQTEEEQEVTYDDWLWYAEHCAPDGAEPEQLPPPPKRNLPRELTEEGLFCLWKEEERNGRRLRIPYDPITRKQIRSGDRSSYASYARADFCRDCGGVGVGLFNGVCAIVVRDCVDENGVYSGDAGEIINLMQSYAEYTPSGDGITVLFQARDWLFDPALHVSRKGALAVYTHGTGGFVPLTGKPCGAYGFDDRTAEFCTFLERYMRREENCGINGINGLNGQNPPAGAGTEAPAAERIEFPPVVPLTPQSGALPHFPVDDLPRAVRDYVRAAAEQTQTAPDMAAVIGLGVLAVCLQGKLRIEGRPGYTEPLSLYVVVTAPPGERKSGVMRAMTGPLYEYERAYNEAHPEAFSPARFFADDCSSEALARLMAQNGGVLSVISTEGGIFDILGGRYSAKANLDIWLKGHCGDMIYVDRIGREAESIPRPTLSAILTIQPSVLSEIMENTTMTGRGLIARFLYATPESAIGARKFRSEPVPPAVQQAYHDLIFRLMAVPMPDEPRNMTLTEEALEVISDHFDEHERWLAGEGQVIADWAGKYIGAVLRIAGLLHAAEADPAEPVPADTMRRAIRIGRYFLAHAGYAYSVMGSDQNMRKAKFVLAKLEALGQPETSRRDLFRLCRGKFFRKAEDLVPTLELLEEHGYLKQLQPERKGNGRPFSARILLNPAAKGVLSI